MAEGTGGRKTASGEARSRRRRSTKHVASTAPATTTTTTRRRSQVGGATARDARKDEGGGRKEATIPTRTSKNTGERRERGCKEKVGRSCASNAARRARRSNTCGRRGEKTEQATPGGEISGRAEEARGGRRRKTKAGSSNKNSRRKKNKDKGREKQRGNSKKRNNKKPCSNYRT